MLTDRLEAAYAVRDAYLPLKHATAAISRQALECTTTMASQREAAGLKIGSGTDSIARIARAAALFIEAEQLVAGAHSELGALIEQAGLRRFYVYGYGAEETVDPKRPSGSADAHIALVQAA